MRRIIEVLQVEMERSVVLREPCVDFRAQRNAAAARRSGALDGRRGVGEAGRSRDIPAFGQRQCVRTVEDIAGAKRIDSRHGHTV